MNVAKRIEIFITCENIVLQIFLHVTQLKKLIENYITNTIYKIQS